MHIPDPVWIPAELQENEPGSIVVIGQLAIDTQAGLDYIPVLGQYTLNLHGTLHPMSDQYDHDIHSGASLYIFYWFIIPLSQDNNSKLFTNDPSLPPKIQELKDYPVAHLKCLTVDDIVKFDNSLNFEVFNSGATGRKNPRLAQTLAQDTGSQETF